VLTSIGSSPDHSCLKLAHFTNPAKGCWFRAFVDLNGISCTVQFNVSSFHQFSVMGPRNGLMD